MSSFISEKIPPIPSLILHSLYSVLPVLQLAALLEHLGKGGSWIDLARTLKHPERDLSLEFIHLFVEVRTRSGWDMKADGLKDRNDP